MDHDGGTKRTTASLALLTLLSASAATAATTIVRLGENRYLLSHSGSMSTAAGGAQGLQEVREKAAALCAIEGFEHFLIRSSDQARSDPNAFTGLLGASGSTSTDVECVTEPTEATLEVKVFPGALLPDTQKKIKQALDEANATDEKKRQKAEKAQAKAAAKDPPPAQ